MTQTTGQDSYSGQLINSEPISNVEMAIKGENPHTFRVAQVIHESPSESIRTDPMQERTLEELIDLEPSFTAHEAVTGIPFIASYYKLDKVYHSIDTQDRLNAKTIDEYISKKVNSKKINDSAESARLFIKELEEKIGLKEYHDPYFRLEKLSKYIKAITDFSNFSTLRPRIIKEVSNGSNG
jgi:hypothetical protein